MRIVEIRDLDGPNLFLMSPAIKVELGDIPENQTQSVIDELTDTIADLHRALGLEVPQMHSRKMEEAGHITVAFEWSQRAFATSLGTWAGQLITGERSNRDQVVEELREIMDREPDEDDAPLLVRATADRAPIVSVTGTNGKTTTSRLIAFTLHHAGNSVGLTSSAGVFIDKQRVLKGDYSGPSGARRVMEHAGVNYAVLETARGGLLLRGCGYEAADVAVITNVTEDHLGIHGIHSIEGLAEVKAIVARNVKPGGFCVLNADNEYTLAMREQTPGVPVLFSAIPNNDIIQNHLADGGSAVHVDKDKNVVWKHEGKSEIVAPLANIPMTFNGLARHQVENALAAIGGLIGIGLPMDDIRGGLAAFKSTAENSQGRLNLFEINGGTVVIDFAHNEAGLVHLLNFARNFVGKDGRLISVVGTAGDREDDALRAIVRRAMESADSVVLKDSVHYLRGREPGDMLAVMRQEAEKHNSRNISIEEAADERAATLQMVEQMQPGDVVAVMCVEDYEHLIEELGKIGVEVA